MIFRHKKNRYCHSNSTHVIYLLICFILIIFAGWNTLNYDLDQYNLYYDDLSSFEILHIADPLFALINNFFKEQGFLFSTFHAIVYVVAMCFMFDLIFQISKKPILIILLYIVTAYVGDVVQMRNFLALPFTLYGLYYLIFDRRNGKIIFAILNLFASAIHIAFCFYFILLFIDVKVKPWLLITSVIALSAIGHTILSNLSSLSYISENAFLSDRADTYQSNSSVWSVVICSFQYILHYYVSYRCVGMKKIKCRQRFMQFTLWISPLIIMTSVNMTFFRLFRNILMFSSVFILNGYYMKHNKNELFLIIIYFMLMSFFHLFWGDTYYNISLILEHNAIGLFM